MSLVEGRQIFDLIRNNINMEQVQTEVGLHIVFIQHPTINTE